MRLWNAQINLRLFLGLLITLLSVDHLDAYKFLGVLHFSSKSHFIVGSALMRGLVEKGHEVTVISPFPLKKPLKNYHDVPVPSVLTIMEKETDGLLETTKRSLLENIVSFHNIGLRVTEAVLNEPSVKALLASNQTFDAVISEVFLAEALYGISEHFKAPLIGLGTFGAIAWNTDMVGSPSPPSYVPNAFLPFTDHMSLKERLINLGFSTFERLFLELYYLPKQEQIYNKYFPDNERNMYDVRKNAALVLLNSHVSLSFPRPYVPNQVEVGGMHINRKRNPLPQDIEKFINESEHGVIYFSMGSNIKAKNLPIEKRRELLKALKSLKQRVLWKFEDPQLEGKPDNVFISDWFPQDDILAHDNVKVFITHGGLLSTTESIYHGKPFIGIPIFGDQFLNMAKAVANGYGIMLDYKNLTATALQQAVETMLANPNYTKLVRNMSKRYKDQPIEPLALATYWVEHVARHKGAKYLHCAGLDMNFIQYHNIDAILILYGGLLFVLVVIVWLLKCLVKLACGKKSKLDNNKKLKKN
ncbi:2-hydroxyacylsphingosine 1-beta-galactosyltransferase [Lucilia cuprina]|nr:2-hydroxyacylsphingosine 1-beta-galactosyltransferase [Lucilia cuprina]